MSDELRLALLAPVLSLACYSPTANGPGGDGAESSTAGGDSTGMTSAPSSTVDPSAPTGEDSIDTADASTDAPADDSTTAIAAVCGNGDVEGDEVCDDGENDGSYGGCEADCTELGPHCGDGVENGDEACDDGDEVNGNGCNRDCVVSGTVLWTVNSSEGYNFLNAGFNDRRVVIDPFGDAYVNGTIRDGGSNDSAVLVRKYSGDGNSVWEHVVNPDEGGATTKGVGVGTATEVVFTLGRIADADAYARRLSAAGSLDWDFSLTDSEGGFSGGVAVDIDESAVVGAALTGGAGAVLSRWSADGDVIWSEVDPEVTDTWRDIMIDDNGEIFACSGTTARRHTANGTTVWSRGSGESTCWGIAPTHDGGAVQAGYGDDDGWLRRIDADGDVVWTETYDGATHDSDAFVDVAFDGLHIIAVGYTYADSERSVLVAKYDLDGELLWTQTATGGGNENSGEGVAVDADDNIFASGYINAPGGANLWLRKLTP